MLEFTHMLSALLRVGSGSGRRYLQLVQIKNIYIFLAIELSPGECCITAKLGFRNLDSNTWRNLTLSEFRQERTSLTQFPHRVIMGKDWWEGISFK